MTSPNATRPAAAGSALEHALESLGYSASAAAAFEPVPVHQALDAHAGSAWERRHPASAQLAAGDTSPGQDN